jgi:hypothetical protein
MHVNQYVHQEDTTGGPVAGDKEESSPSDNGERPKPIFDTDKTPIAGDKGDPIKNNKSPSPI